MGEIETTAEDEESEEPLYNEKEKQALILFRQEVECFSIDVTDHFLIKWLRARNLDQKKAKEMLENYCDWLNTNELLPKPGDDWIAPSILREDFKYKFFGFDDCRRPVIWMPLGRWEVRKRLEEGLKDDCFRFAYRILAELKRQVEEQRQLRPDVSQFVGIFDCAELSFRKISVETMQCVLRFCREFEAYYPESITACYVVNAPMVFSFIFNLIKPLMSSHTLGKIHVFDFNDTKWKPFLRSKIPIEILPEDYGGNAPPVLS